MGVLEVCGLFGEVLSASALPPVSGLPERGGESETGVGGRGDKSFALGLSRSPLAPGVVFLVIAAGVVLFDGLFGRMVVIRAGLVSGKL